MGGSESVDNSQFLTLAGLQSEVDKFCSSELTKEQFLQDLFPCIEEAKHPIGNVSILNTYIMERFYLILTKNQNGANVSCARINEVL